MTLMKGIEVLAWILFVVGAFGVPIKYHRAEYGPHQQKALLILGILPGSILLIILGVYRDTHGEIGTSPHLTYQSTQHAVTQHTSTQAQQPPLECGMIQSVINKSQYIELTIQFETTNQVRRFEFLDQGQKFEAHHRMCIRADHSIEKNDVNYLKQVS